MTKKAPLTLADDLLVGGVGGNFYVSVHTPDLIYEVLKIRDVFPASPERPKMAVIEINPYNFHGEPRQIQGISSDLSDFLYDRRAPESFSPQKVSSPQNPQQSSPG